SIRLLDLGMTDAALEYIQLLTQSEILQCHLFITRKYQQDRPNNNQDSVQHSAASLSASLIKINCLRDRRDLARDRFGDKALGLKELVFDVVHYCQLPKELENRVNDFNNLHNPIFEFLVLRQGRASAWPVGKMDLSIKRPFSSGSSVNEHG